MDNDQSVDDFTGVNLKPGEDDHSTRFIDGDNGSMSGTVKDDNGVPLKDVLIDLHKGGVVQSTTKALADGSYKFADGSYKFADVEPDTYQVRETNPPGYDTDISDHDTTAEDASDGNTKVDNLIDVVVTPSEADKNNDFVDSAKGSISGNVMDDSKLVLTNVMITLETQDGVTNVTKATIIGAALDVGAAIVTVGDPLGAPETVGPADTLGALLKSSSTKTRAAVLALLLLCTVVTFGSPPSESETST